jgi:hypothetical protein
MIIIITDADNDNCENNAFDRRGKRKNRRCSCIRMLHRRLHFQNCKGLGRLAPYPLLVTPFAKRLSFALCVRTQIYNSQPLSPVRSLFVQWNNTAKVQRYHFCHYLNYYYYFFSVSYSLFFLLKEQKRIHYCRRQPCTQRPPRCKNCDVLCTIIMCIIYSLRNIQPCTLIFAIKDVRGWWKEIHITPRKNGIKYSPIDQNWEMGEYIFNSSYSIQIYTVFISNRIISASRVNWSI